MRKVEVEDGDGFELSSGRILHANGTLGLVDNEDCPTGLQMTKGLDTVAHEDPCQYSMEMDPEYCQTVQLKPEERKEIADFMIEKWRRWAGLDPAA